MISKYLKLLDLNECASTAGEGDHLQNDIETLIL